eukprot:g16139.t1
MFLKWDAPRTSAGLLPSIPLLTLLTALSLLCYASWKSTHLPVSWKLFAAKEQSKWEPRDRACSEVLVKAEPNGGLPLLAGVPPPSRGPVCVFVPSGFVQRLASSKPRLRALRAIGIESHSEPTARLYGVTEAGAQRTILLATGRPADHVPGWLCCWRRDSKGKPERHPLLQQFSTNELLINLEFVDLRHLSWADKLVIFDSLFNSLVKEYSLQRVEAPVVQKGGKVLYALCYIMSTSASNPTASEAESGAIVKQDVEEILDRAARHVDIDQLARDWLHLHNLLHHHHKNTSALHHNHKNTSAQSQASSPPPEDHVLMSDDRYVAMSERLLHSVSSLSPPLLVKLWTSASQLDSGHPLLSALADATVAAVTSSAGTAFTPEELAGVLQAVDKLPQSLRASSKQLAELPERCWQTLQANAERAAKDPATLANFTSRLAAISFFHDEGNEGTLVRSLLDRLTEPDTWCAMNSTSMMLVVSAMERTAYPLCQPFLRNSGQAAMCAFETISANQASLSAQELALALDFLGKVQQCLTALNDHLPLWTPRHSADLTKVVDEASLRVEQGEASSRDLALMLHGIATLKYDPGAASLELFARECSRRRQEFGLQEIGWVLQAFAACSSYANSTLAHDRFFLPMLSAVMQEKKPCQGSILALALDGLVKLGHRPAKKALDTLCSNCLGKGADSHLTPSTVATLLDVFHTLNYSPKAAVMSTLSSALLTHAQPRPALSESALSYHQAVSCLNAFASARHFPPREVLNMLASCLLPTLRQADSSTSESFASSGRSTTALELCQTFSAFAKLNYYPGPDIFQALGAALTSSKQLNSLSLQETALLLSSWSKLNGVQHRSGSEQTSEQAAAGQRLPLSMLVEEILAKAKQDPRSTYIPFVLHAFCVMDEVEVASILFQQLIPELSIAPSDENFHALNQLYTVALTLEWLYPTVSVRWPSGLQQAVLDQAMATLRKTDSSALQKDVSRIMKAGPLRLPHKKEDTQTGLSVDISLVECKIAIEVDGPYHFSHDREGRPRPLGATLLKKRILQAMGWRVLSVPYFEWAQCASDKEKTNYIRTGLSKLDVPGRPMPQLPPP